MAQPDERRVDSAPRAEPWGDSGRTAARGADSVPWAACSDGSEPAVHSDGWGRSDACSVVPVSTDGRSAYWVPTDEQMGEHRVGSSGWGRRPEKAALPEAWAERSGLRAGPVARCARRTASTVPASLGSTSEAAFGPEASHAGQRAAGA